jgi:hypothetical protein
MANVVGKSVKRGGGARGHHLSAAATATATARHARDRNMVEYSVMYTSYNNDSRGCLKFRNQ